MKKLLLAPGYADFDGGRGSGLCPGVHFRREGSSLDLLQEQAPAEAQRLGLK
jgi:hypothetical protein